MLLLGGVEFVSGVRSYLATMLTDFPVTLLFLNFEEEKHRDRQKSYSVYEIHHFDLNILV